ncbi:MAG: hypothetical protein A3B11_02235 [Candidatus Taylorbacteria bacterium RIFCSPLOWO2_01_FULL_44_26]|uniref:DUF1761 domain-containing protein n=2 Tax=Candidatus Tayloriibacteriota TaxID=1817919 RepID=A0A1G2MKF1_9BACT|nr:MAG: hypothetical protein A3D50_02360 [Candidatus Taylorbacteria bacterium RIFCSPHIGHO2_02_FULL_44_12]OHA30783.1 MAG: hypothetical protein A3B11_02235 [Candidatus Taylorbacteria bacterium RIFCSPLOWO2_01_FULL_44_26]
MENINIWSIIVAGVVSFGIGALWYSPVLFGKEWLALTKVGQSDIDITKTQGMWKSYLTHFIFGLISFGVLAFLATATGVGRAEDGAFLGLIAWLGFSLPGNISELLWKKAPFKLIVIDAVNTLISLVVGGAIIGAWV